MEGSVLIIIYTFSDELYYQIKKVNRKVQNNINKKIKLEEYISLPEFGQVIILRYYIADNKLNNQNELNNLESKLRTIVGDKYWVMTRGEVYKKLGFKFNPNILEKINEHYPDNIISYPQTKFQKLIKKDAKYIRKKLNIDKENKIYELEVPFQLADREEKLKVIRILFSNREKSEKETFKIEDNSYKIETNLNLSAWKGNLKAYILASRSNKALLNFLMDFS